MNNCTTCEKSLGNSKLKRNCRACVDTRKSLKEERQETKKCGHCKLYKDNDDYIEAKVMKTCIDCRRYKPNRLKASEESNTSSTPQCQEAIQEDLIEACTDNTANILEHVAIYLKDKHNTVSYTHLTLPTKA